MVKVIQSSYTWHTHVILRQMILSHIRHHLYLEKNVTLTKVTVSNISVHVFFMLLDRIRMPLFAKTKWVTPWRDFCIRCHVGSFFCFCFYIFIRIHSSVTKTIVLIGKYFAMKINGHDWMRERWCNFRWRGNLKMIIISVEGQYVHNILGISLC